MLQFFRQNFKIIALLTKIEKLESFGAEITSTYFLPDKTFTVIKSINMHVFNYYNIISISQSLEN